jgi:uncharacterized protein (DUF169 family)
MSLSTFRAKAYMQSVIADHVDPATGLVNATQLAEDCADHFGFYEADACQSSDIIEYIPAEWVFDLAVDLAEAYERNAS